MVPLPPQAVPAPKAPRGAPEGRQLGWDPTEGGHGFGALFFSPPKRGTKRLCSVIFFGRGDLKTQFCEHHIFLEGVMKNEHQPELDKKKLILFKGNP